LSAVTHWLNTELHVWRASLVADGSGGFTETLVDQAVNPTPKFKVDQSSAAEQQVAQQDGASHTHNIFAEPDADVERGDWLAPSGVDPNDLTAGETAYQVISTTQPSTPRYLKCAAERIEVA